MFVQENHDCLPRELIFIIFHWLHYSIHLRVGLVRDLWIVIILILISRLKVCIILQLSSRNTVPPTGKCYWNILEQVQPRISATNAHETMQGDAWLRENHIGFKVRGLRSGCKGTCTQTTKHGKPTTLLQPCSSKHSCQYNCGKFLIVPSPDFRLVCSLCKCHQRRPAPGMMVSPLCAKRSRPKGSTKVHSNFSVYPSEESEESDKTPVGSRDLSKRLRYFALFGSGGAFIKAMIQPVSLR